jgi:hypothetical protein
MPPHESKLPGSALRGSESLLRSRLKTKDIQRHCTVKTAVCRGWGFAFGFAFRASLEIDTAPLMTVLRVGHSQFIGRESLGSPDSLDRGKIPSTLRRATFKSRCASSNPSLSGRVGVKRFQTTPSIVSDVHSQGPRFSSGSALGPPMMGSGGCGGPICQRVLAVRLTAGIGIRNGLASSIVPAGDIAPRSAEFAFSPVGFLLCTTERDHRAIIRAARDVQHHRTLLVMWRQLLPWPTASLGASDGSCSCSWSHTNETSNTL